MSYRPNELQRSKETRSTVMPRQSARKSSLRAGCSVEIRHLNRHILPESLLLEMLPLVRRIALKIHRRLPAHVDVDDLIGNGTLGLVDAVAKFDPSKGVKLETYARHRVRGAILDCPPRCKRASSLPV